MKVYAIVVWTLAILVRFGWHSSQTVAIPISPTTHIWYPVSSLVFWGLVALAVLLTLLALSLPEFKQRR